MPRHNYSMMEILLHTPGEEEEAKFPKLQNLGFDLMPDWINYICDMYEDLMLKSEGVLFILMKNKDIFYYHFTRLSDRDINCKFYSQIQSGERRLLSDDDIVLGDFLNNGPKDIIDLYEGQRDISNEMTRLINKYVEQEDISLFSMLPD